MCKNGFRIVIAGIIFAVISQIIHSLCAFFSMDFYTDPSYLSVWTKIMMPNMGPPGIEFFYYSISFAIISGILFALVYNVVKDALKSKCLGKKGLLYGFLIFLVAGVPGSLSLFLLINLSSVLILLWAIENLIIYLIGGLITAFIIKK